MSKKNDGGQSALNIFKLLKLLCYHDKITHMWILKSKKKGCANLEITTSKKKLLVQCNCSIIFREIFLYSCYSRTDRRVTRDLAHCTWVLLKNCVIRQSSLLKRQSIFFVFIIMFWFEVQMVGVILRGSALEKINHHWIIEVGWRDKKVRVVE